ncbi:MAG: glycosyltransferase [Clostridia bacterium]|nr:glycosyltransferase [Clostridia bacterium]
MNLSIIVCVYNTDRVFFEKCLSSITASTLDRGSYEICVVDDGSTVDYTDLIEKYGLKYKKTENRGIFSARLTGIDMAEGDYITFVDSDDSVSMNYHRPMLECAQRHDCDIVINAWAFHTDRTRYYCRADSTISTSINCEGDDILYRFVESEGREHSYYVLWNKVVRGSVFKAVAEELRPMLNRESRFNYGEDALMTFFAYKYAKRLKNVNTGYYFYRIHANQSVNVISEARLRSQIECMGEVFERMLNGIGENVHREKIEASIKMWQMLMLRTHYSHAKANGYTDLYELIKSTYGGTKLRTSTLKDSSSYKKNKVIPYNFDEIDAELLKIWHSDEHTAVSLKGADEYMRRTVQYFVESGKSVEISPDGARLPRPRVKFINKIILNPFVYSLGLLLFKKGSRIRSFLKKHI